MKGGEKQLTNQNNVFKQILKSIPFLISIIVLISYVENYAFYQNFGITISSYSSIYELLFSFIPSFLLTPIKTILELWIIPLVILIILFVDYSFDFKFITYIKELLDNQYEFCKSKNKVKCFNFLKLLYWIIFIFMIFSFIFIFKLLIHFFLVKDIMPLSHCLNLIGISIDYNSISKNWTLPDGNHHGIFLLIFITWMFFLYVISYRFLKKCRKLKKITYGFNLYFIITVLFVFTSIKNLQRIEMLKDKDLRKNEIMYEFIYDTTVIKTNSDKVSIAGTRDFIIIRDFHDSVNYLYSTNNLKLIKTNTKSNNVSNVQWNIFLQVNNK